MLLFRDSLPEAHWTDEAADVYGGEATELEGVTVVEEATIDVVDEGAPMESRGTQGGHDDGPSSLMNN